MYNCSNITLPITQNIIDHCEDICVNTIDNDENKCICNCIYQNNNDSVVDHNRIMLFLLFITGTFFFVFLCSFIRVKLRYRITNNHNYDNNNDNTHQQIISTEQINYYSILDLKKSLPLPEYKDISNNIFLPPNYNDISTEQELNFIPFYIDKE
jgi:hypothetical protein